MRYGLSSVIQSRTGKVVLSGLCLAGIVFGSVATPMGLSAEAHRRYDGYHSRYDRDYYRGGSRPMFSYKTGKILKGSLVGAGIGAGSAVVFDKPMLKSTVLGAGIGAGVQAIRYW